MSVLTAKHQVCHAPNRQEAATETTIQRDSWYPTEGDPMNRRGLAVLTATIVLVLGMASADAGTTPSCHGMTATIVGTEGDDRIRGTEGPDVMVGLGGSDGLYGAGGDDWICGGPGNDATYTFPYPGAVDGELAGGPGVDRVWGGAGNDEIYGGESGSTGYDSGAGDYLYGGKGHDRVCDAFCYQTDFSYSDEPGADQLFGGPGSDSLVDSKGADFVSGGGGDDLVMTEMTYDNALNPSGRDIYFGGAGNDQFRVDDGVSGNDTVNGQADSDACVADQEDSLTNCESYELDWYPR